MSGNNEFNEKIQDAARLSVSAAMFLSRLPLQGLSNRLTRDTGAIDDNLSFDKSSRYFGIAAIVVSLPAVLVFWIFFSLLGISPLIAAILTVTAIIATTGALHEDALADVADGFGGGSTREKKLVIMRDSQIGTFGACALILSLALQIACFSQLVVELGTLGFMLVIVAINVAPTSSMVWPWATQNPARTEGGLSASHGLPSEETATVAMLIGFSISLVLLWMAVGVFPAVISLLVCWSCMILFSRFVHAQIGGHTGDSLGATKKISELGLLLTLIVAT